jgi:CTP synthase (UTP-ammonia lyase)
MKTTRIGIIGDFNPANPTHLMTQEAIQYAGAALDRPFHSDWLATEKQHDYSAWDGLWGSPGSPYRSMENALSAIRYAREHAVPFLGTCGGFQHAVLEYPRNVAGIQEAAHEEYDPYASVLFLSRLSCSLVGKVMPVTIREGSRAAAIYGCSRSEEAYYCNFGLNPAYESVIEAHGLNISARDDAQEVRIVELPAHPFFLGTLFLPQARSNAGRPHPIVSAFCAAAAEGGD